MKLKTENGITLITLIVTVIILAILAFVVVRISIGIGQSAKFENVKTYMLLIKSKCEILVNEKAIGEVEENYYGEQQSGGDYDGWYRLSQADLNDIGVSNTSLDGSSKMSTKGADATDGYYVWYDEDTGTVDVAYAKGIVNDDTVYYKLSEIPE